jgi:hypothetical protein
MLTTYLLYWSWKTPNQVRLIKRLVGVLGVGFLIGVVLSILLGRSLAGTPTVFEAVAYGVGDLVDRILFGNVKVPFASYALFPWREGYLWGASYLQNVMAFLPWDSSPSYAVTFYQLVTRDRFAFTAPPDLYTEGFINFGFAGTALVGLLYGLGLAALQRRIAECQRVSSLSWLALICAVMAYGSFGGFSFLMGGLIAMFYVRAVLAVVKIVCRRVSQYTAAATPRCLAYELSTHGAAARNPAPGTGWAQPETSGQRP